MTVPKISVIVPVYNAERYLDECVSSLARQTFPQIEVLLVDDGSTDASGGKCDAWAAKDGRIHAIHQSNAGVSAARNAGLDHARGEWVAFADADDWLEDDAFETLSSVEMTKTADMVLFNYRKAGDQQPEEPIPDGFLEVSDALDAVLAYHGVKGYVWNKLFRRELIQRARARFDTAIGMCEDLLFDVTCLVHAKRVYSMNRCLYNYRENPDSALHAIKPEVARTCLIAHERMLGMVPETSRSAVQASDAIMAEEFLMRTYASHDVRNRDDYYAVLRRYWRQAFVREHSLKYRLRLVGGAWCPSLFYPMWNMLKGSN